MCGVVGAGAGVGAGGDANNTQQGLRAFPGQKQKAEEGRVARAGCFLRMDADPPARHSAIPTTIRPCLLHLPHNHPGCLRPPQARRRAARRCWVGWTSASPATSLAPRSTALRRSCQHTAPCSSMGPTASSAPCSSAPPQSLRQDHRCARGSFPTVLGPRDSAT